MPEMYITSYGHCYHVLIVSNLIKSGVPRTDAGIGTSFIFAERLAFATLTHMDKNVDLDFDLFLREYKKRYLIPDAILSRLQHDDYGIITKEGRFKTLYMYYYFIGLFLSKNIHENRSIVETICSKSHVTRNLPYTSLYNPSYKRTLDY